MNRHIKEEIQIASKHVKSVNLIREKEIGTTAKSYYTTHQNG